MAPQRWVPARLIATLKAALGGAGSGPGSPSESDVDVWYWSSFAFFAGGGCAKWSSTLFGGGVG